MVKTTWLALRAVVVVAQDIPLLLVAQVIHLPRHHLRVAMVVTEGKVRYLVVVVVVGRRVLALLEKTKVVEMVAQELPAQFQVHRLHTLAVVEVVFMTVPLHPVKAVQVVVVLEATLPLVEQQAQQTQAVAVAVAETIVVTAAQVVAVL